MICFNIIHKYKIPNNDFEFDNYKEVDEFLKDNDQNMDFIFLKIVKKYQCVEFKKMFNNYEEACEYLENKRGKYEVVSDGNLA